MFLIFFQDSEHQTSNTKQNSSDTSQCLDSVQQQIDSVSSVISDTRTENGFLSEFTGRMVPSANESAVTTSVSDLPGSSKSAASSDSHKLVFETRDDSSATSSSGSSWDHLQKEAMSFVSQTLQRGRKNLWQLTTSRISVLLSCSGVCSTSVHQFLKNYEDLNIFILAGETFCGVEAVEFRQRLKTVCESYFAAFHRQNLYVSRLMSLLTFPSRKNIANFSVIVCSRIHYNAIPLCLFIYLSPLFCPRIYLNPFIVNTSSLTDLEATLSFF